MLHSTFAPVQFDKLKTHGSVTLPGLPGLYFMFHWYVKQHPPTPQPLLFYHKSVFSLKAATANQFPKCTSICLQYFTGQVNMTWSYLCYRYREWVV